MRLAVTSERKMRTRLDDENTIKALEYHKKFVELMPTEGEYSTVNTLFREGKAHSTIGGPWLVPTARESGIDLGIAPMPTVDETGNKIAPYSGVQGIHVLKVAAERKHDAIAKVLQVLTNDSVGIAMAKASGCAPAKQSCYDDPVISGDDMVMAMYDTAQDAVPMPNVPRNGRYVDVTENLLVDVNMSGKRRPKQRTGRPAAGREPYQTDAVMRKGRTMKKNKKERFGPICAAPPRCF